MVQYDIPLLPDPTEHQKMAPRASITAGVDNRRQSTLHSSQSGLECAGSSRHSLFRNDKNNSLRSLSSQGSKRTSRPARMGRRISAAVLRVKDVFKKRNVKIVEKNNQIMLIEQLNEFDEEQIKRVWFTEEEINEMKVEIEQMAASIDAGHSEVDGRGLENKTEEGNWNAYKARKDVTNALLDEQDRQQNVRVVKFDCDALRKVCIEISERLQDEALIRGQGDEMAVQEYLRVTKAEWNCIKEALDAAMIARTFDDAGSDDETLPPSPETRKQSVGRRINLLRTGSKRKMLAAKGDAELAQSNLRRVSMLTAESPSKCNVPPPESSITRGRFSMLSRKQVVIEDPSDSDLLDGVLVTPGPKKVIRRLSLFGGRGSLNKALDQPISMPLSPVDMEASDSENDLESALERMATVLPPPIISPGTQGRKAKRSSWFMKASARFENGSSATFTAAT